MSLPKKTSRLFAIALSAAIVAATLLPAPPAVASEPPFEIRFPQETQHTVFSSSFGAARSGGRSHTGNDLMAPKMTQVYAAADGVITVVATSNLAGRYLEIDHVGGWSTRYIHLNNDNPSTDDGSADWDLTVVPGLVEGSRVVAGEHIAWVGDSGNAEGSGSHTHFEIAYQGGAIDPYPLLKGAFLRDNMRYLDALRRLVPSIQDKRALLGLPQPKATALSSATTSATKRGWEGETVTDSLVPVVGTSPS